MNRAELLGDFVQGAKGPLFVVLRRPSTQPLGCVLVVPPFAEEMNKCRRMVYELSSALAGSGVATLVPDLYGTGDSGGDFLDADWSGWQSDLGVAARWSAERGCPVTGILGIRTGCLLAASASEGRTLPAPRFSVFWQPVLEGKRFVTQFLRLRAAASLMESRQETVADLRREIAGGSALEVAGYMLSPGLANSLEGETLAAGRLGDFGQLLWLEVSRDVASGLPPASSNIIKDARDRGADVSIKQATGEPFWSSTEIVINQDVVRATALHFSRFANQFASIDA